MNAGTSVMAAILAVRVVIALLQQGAKAQPGSGGAPGTGGGGSWVVAVWLVLVPLALGFGIGLLAGQLWCAAALALLLVIIAPWLIVKLALIPLGLPRAAYHVTRLSDWTWRADRRGGAALAAAWALARARRPAPEVEAWVMDQLNGAIGGAGAAAAPAAVPPLSGAGVAAGAMLAAQRGDLEGARSLFESVATLDERVCPREARRIAAGFLAAEAASRGDWEAVREHARVGGGRALALLDAVAARLLGDVLAPGPWALWLRWLAAPRRRATLPLVRRALAAGSDAPSPEPEEPELHAAKVAEGDLLGRAVMLHAKLLLRRGGGVTGDDLRRLGGAWDAALEDERAQSELRERALVIGASGARAATEPLARAIEEDLAALARAARVPHEAWDDLGATIGRTSRRLRDELLSEIEVTCDALRRRVDDRRDLPPLDEWREWTALRAQYERAGALAGLSFRRLAFPKVHADVCHAAVRLFNERKQRAIGNAMFRFLLAEAEALGDTRAAGLQRKNVDCGV
jgi:hypothetical protein